LQLCSEAERTLGAVLAGECDDDVLRELTVVSVVRAPNAGRLLVTVALPPSAGVPAEEVLQRLLRASGRLHSEVAGCSQDALNREKRFTRSCSGSKRLARAQRSSGKR
jgi:hypothetical protein